MEPFLKQEEVSVLCFDVCEDADGVDAFRIKVAQ